MTSSTRERQSSCIALHSLPVRATAPESQRLNRDTQKPRKRRSAAHVSRVTLQLPTLTRAFPNVTSGSSHPLWRAFFPKASEIPHLRIQPRPSRGWAAASSPGTGQLQQKGLP